MMEEETWLTAEQAKERGLIDAVMFEETEDVSPLVAGAMFRLPSAEQMGRVRNMLKQAGSELQDPAFLMQARLNLLKMRGEQR